MKKYFKILCLFAICLGASTVGAQTDGQQTLPKDIGTLLNESEALEADVLDWLNQNSTRLVRLTNFQMNGLFGAVGLGGTSGKIQGEGFDVPQGYQVYSAKVINRHMHEVAEKIRGWIRQDDKYYIYGEGKNADYNDMNHSKLIRSLLDFDGAHNIIADEDAYEWLKPFEEKKEQLRRRLDLLSRRRAEFDNRQGERFKDLVIEARGIVVFFEYLGRDAKLDAQIDGNWFGRASVSLTDNGTRMSLKYSEFGLLKKDFVLY